MLDNINILSKHLIPIMALAPKADAYATSFASDIISMVQYPKVVFYVMEGAGGTGTVKLQVQACDDFSATNTTAIPFKYRVASNSGTLTDQFGAVTDATAADGYTTVAGANKMIEITVDVSDLPSGKDKIRLIGTEVVDSACAAGILAFGLNGRVINGTMPTAIA